MKLFRKLSEEIVYFFCIYYFRKESVIKSLAKDLAESEEQYAMALRSHLQNVDNLIGNLVKKDNFHGKTLNKCSIHSKS